jgi:Rrf2 family protein
MSIEKVEYRDDIRQGGGETVRIPAKSDDAVRAVVAIARAGDDYCKAELLAGSEGIAFEYLQNILRELRQAGILDAKRGYDGGFRLARPAGEITVGDVLDAIGSPLTEVPNSRDAAVWTALDASARAVLTATTIAHLAVDTAPRSRPTRTAS